MQIIKSKDQTTTELKQKFPFKDSCSYSRVITFRSKAMHMFNTSNKLCANTQIMDTLQHTNFLASSNSLSNNKILYFWTFFSRVNDYI